MKKNPPTLLACIFMFFLTSFSIAQTNHCGQIEYEQFLRSQDPNYDAKQQQFEQQLQGAIAQIKKNPTTQSLYTIPVVFHVIYNTPGQNIPDGDILAALDLLNKDYRRLNADAGNTPTAFLPMATDMEVQFCLATLDPNGNATNGITRTSTGVSSFGTDNKMKYTAQGGLDVWNSSHYMNVWICNLGSGLLGYAQFPGGSSATAGVVISYQYLGPNGTAPYNKNRTMTHEVGHYLNLRHIWGDANCGDDQCTDTPTQQSSNFNCPTFPHVTCSNGPNGDMFMNFMDYTDDACMNMFTGSQKARVQAVCATTYASIVAFAGTGCSSGPVAADAGISAVTKPGSIACGSTISPEVTLKNFGTSTISSCTINYSMDANPNQTYNWTGNLAASQTVSITLPTLTITAGSHTMDCSTSNPNNLADTNPANDQISSNFTGIAPPTVSVTNDISTCIGNNLTLTASGATSFSWSTGGTDVSIVVSPTTSSTYTVIGSNAGNCTDTNTVHVTISPSPTITINSTNNVTSCTGNDGSVDISVSGGVGSYVYLWSPGNYTTEDITGLGVGSYSILANSDSGCVASASVIITSPSTLSVSVNSIIPAGCNFSNGSISAITNGGTPTYSYAWLPSGGSSSAASGLAIGTYTLNVTDANGCSSLLTTMLGDSCDYVWPGDANDDGIASNLDILTLGIGYGSTGPIRANASSTWVGQPCNDWSNSLSGNVNYKNIDCNGDGIINDDDTLAVVQNFGMTHNNRDGHINTTSGTDLYLQISSTNIGSGGSLVTVQIGLGSPSSPASNVYGLAYEINFNNPALVDPASISFSGLNSWMGTVGTNLLSVGFPNGEVALTRTDHANANGNGIIQTMQFRTSTSLNGTGNSAPLILSIVNPTIISFNETIIPANPIADSVIVQDTLMTTSINYNADLSSQVSIYPNPASGQVSIFGLEFAINSQLSICNVLGETIFLKTINSKKESLDITALPKGVYFLNIKTTNGVVVKKIIKE